MKLSKRMVQSCATFLALSLIVGLCPVSDVSAAVTPKLVKKVSVTKGKKKTVKIKGVKKSKIKKLKIKSSKKRIVTAKKKGKNRIVLTGKKAGKSKITVTVTYKSGKKMKKKKLKCTVTVKNPSVISKVPAKTSIPSVTKSPDVDSANVSVTSTPVVTNEPTEEPVVSPSVEPTATPEITATPTAEPTQTPIVTPTPEPTATPEPTVPPFGYILDENGDYEGDGLTVEHGVLTEYDGSLNEKPLVIPEGITEIGEASCADSVFESITIPDTVTKIDDYAFSNTTVLSDELVVPGTVKLIGNEAFSDLECDTVVLSEGTETIYNRCFSGSSVRTLTVPSTVTYLGDSAFSNCSSLSSFTYEGTPTVYRGTNLFENDNVLSESVTTHLAENCSHENGYSYMLSEVTCTSDGKERYVCYDCGSVIDSVIPSHGHDWEQYMKTQVTCTNDGLLARRCKSCGMDEDVRVIPQFDHSYAQTSHKDATCTEAGYTIETCKMCGKEVRTEHPVLNHNIVPEYYVGDEHPGAHVDVRCKCTRCSYRCDLLDLSCSDFGDVFMTTMFAGTPNVNAQVFVSLHLQPDYPLVTKSKDINSNEYRQYINCKNKYMAKLESLYQINGGNVDVWVLSDGNQFPSQFVNCNDAVKAALYEFEAKHENGIHRFDHGVSSSNVQYMAYSGLRPYISNIRGGGNSTAELSKVTVRYQGYDRAFTKSNVSVNTMSVDNVKITYAQINDSLYFYYPIYIITYVGDAVDLDASGFAAKVKQYQTALDKFWNNQAHGHCLIYAVHDARYLDYTTGNVAHTAAAKFAEKHHNGVTSNGMDFMNE